MTETSVPQIKFLRETGYEAFDAEENIFVEFCSAPGDPFVQKKAKIVFCPVIRQDVSLNLNGQCQQFECDKNTEGFAFNA